MKRIMYFLLIIFLFSCKETNVSSLVSQDGKYAKSPEECLFYCWCYEMFPKASLERGTTSCLSRNITVKEIVSDSSLFKGKIRDKKQLNYISHNLLETDNKKLMDFNCTASNSRVAFLIINTDKTIDTISYINKHELCINGKLYLFKEKVDSILNKLNSPIFFNCPENFEKQFPFLKDFK